MLPMNSNNAQSSNCMCSYCENSYQDPRILSCLHSYCLQCIYKIHVQKDTPSITCPSCNHLTPVPIGGVASLPLNIRFKEEALQGKLLQQIISSPPVCDSCEEDSSVSAAYCMDCDDLLCQDCWDMHRKMKLLRSHTTIATKDLKNQQTEQSKKPLFSASSEVCPNHKMDFGFYCKQCAVLVCGGCGFEKHSKHSTTVLKISEQVARTKEEILQGTERLPEKMTQLKKTMKTISETKKKLKVYKEKVDSIIQEAFCRLRQLIDQREKALLAENSEIAISKETRLSIQQESLQHLFESMNQCHSLSSIATSQYTDVQLLSIAQTVQKRADSLKQKFTNISLELSETPDISVEVNTDTLAQMIREFGGVADPSPSSSNTTAVIPRQKLGIEAEMKVKVTTRDSRGKEPNKGGSVVRGILTCSGQRIECPVSDNGDGTYLVSVIPQQLGQHQLSVIVSGRGIQGSPFKLSVVAQRDYTKLKYPVKTITGINRPMYIAFSDTGDMFVTSDCDHCIHVYDTRGKKKTTIGSEGSGELQFNEPQGIAITGDVIYVAEHAGHRIHKLTTGGEFLGTFGESGSDIGQFDGPCDIKISPDGKVYVADSDNNRVQVFHPDWTYSHVIDGNVSDDDRFTSPKGLAFDLSGNVHVSAYGSSSVTVLTPSGQFVCQYDTKTPEGIAIDPSGYSLVNNPMYQWGFGTLSIFDPSGKLIHSVGGFNHPFGVSVSPDGSVWVADRSNNRLIKY